MSAWLDDYIPVTANTRSGGGTYTGQVWRIVLHTTEFDVSSLANLKAVATRHFAPPHLWYRPVTRWKVQTVPLNRSAFALRRDSGDPQTNKANALQVEIVGSAATIGDLSDQALYHMAEDVIVPFIKYARSQGGDVELVFHGTPGLAEGRYGENAPNRMSWNAWFGFNGITSHYGVPGQSHWDTGTLDVDKLLTFTRQLMEGEDMTPEQYDRLYRNVDNTRVWLKPKLDKLQADIDALSEELDNLVSPPALAPSDGTVEVGLSDKDVEDIAKAAAELVLAELRKVRLGYVN